MIFILHNILYTRCHSREKLKMVCCLWIRVKKNNCETICIRWRIDSHCADLVFWKINGKTISVQRADTKLYGAWRRMSDSEICLSLLFHYIFLSYWLSLQFYPVLLEIKPEFQYLLFSDRHRKKLLSFLNLDNRIKELAS